MLLILSGCPEELADRSNKAEEEDTPPELGAAEKAALAAKDHTHRWEEGLEPGEKGDVPSPTGGGLGGGPAGVLPPVPGAELLVLPAPTIVHSELGPEDLVRHYLMLGSAGDLSRITDYVEPRCFRGPVGRVDSVRLVGTLMTLEALTLGLESENESKAVVNFHLIGGIAAGEKKSEISIEGEELPERTSLLTTSGVERRGWLGLTLVDRLWRVTCAFDYEPLVGGSGLAP